MLSFGFDMCIKVNSPLVNCPISDTLLDAKPHFNQTPLQFISVLIIIFPINTLLQYSTYPVLHSIKVRTVIGGHRSGVMKSGSRVAATVSHFTLLSATK